MRLVPSRGLQLVAAAASGALIAGGGYAIASTSNSSKVIHGCVQVHTRLLEVKARCTRGTQRLTWNQQGPQGIPGPAASSIFAEARHDQSANGIVVQRNSTLVATSTPGAYIFSFSASKLIPDVSSCVVTASPITSEAPLAPQYGAATLASHDTATLAERANSDQEQQWDVQVTNSAGQPVNDGVTVAAFC
jgi:hypothetical protein